MSSVVPFVPPPPRPRPGEVLLDVRGLKVSFDTGSGPRTVVDGLDLSVSEGECVCLVGESGCGKSVSSRAILGLLPQPPAVVRSSQLTLCGQDLRDRSERELRRIRGRLAGLVFQEPMIALNPVIKVGVQIMEGARAHTRMSQAAARGRALELLEAVGIPEPALRLKAYPHELSGGMRQRVMLAVALASEPRLLIADEPTTALDVTVQAQILRLLDELRRSRGLGLLFITHDLGVVAQIADRVIVLYGGQVMESGPVEAIFSRRAHPYTAGLLDSLPRMGRRDPAARLASIPGQVPAAGDWPRGCRFSNRCAWCIEDCRREAVPLIEQWPDHWVRCIRSEDRTRSGARGGQRA